MRKERERPIVASDWDGTITDTFANAENYRGATVNVLSGITGISAVELRDVLEVKKLKPYAKIRQDMAGSKEFPSGVMK